jgi:hypothetical protein
VDNIIVSTAPAIPQLAIFQTATNTAVISWPWPSSGFVLLECPLLGATNWTGVTNPVDVVSGQNQVTVSPPIGNRYYRLFHP